VGHRLVAGNADHAAERRAGARRKGGGGHAGTRLFMGLRGAEGEQKGKAF
jgi:hypothetical protein